MESGLDCTIAKDIFSFGNLIILWKSVLIKNFQNKYNSTIFKQCFQTYNLAKASTSSINGLRDTANTLYALHTLRSSFKNMFSTYKNIIFIRIIKNKKPHENKELLPFHTLIFTNFITQMRVRSERSWIASLRSSATFPHTTNGSLTSLRIKI